MGPVWLSEPSPRARGSLQTPQRGRLAAVTLAALAVLFTACSAAPATTAPTAPVLELPGSEVAFTPHDARPPEWALRSDALAPDDATSHALADAAAPLAALEPTEVEAPVGPLARLAIPFRTQRDGSRWAGSNCGPAALGMILEARGIVQTNDDLRFLSHTYQGTVGARTGTALEHIARVAEDYGVGTRGLYARDNFRQWSVEDIRAEVAAGNPVMALVKYRLLPGREGAAVRFDHYIVLWDLTPDGFVYNDSSYIGMDEGFARTLTSAQLEAAMQPTLVPRQAVAFVLDRA